MPLGQGTWRMGQEPRRRADEVAALRLGFELGLTMIDTAEMYADGEAERLVAEAIRGRRDQVFLVSKVLPHHASHAGTLAAAEASLARLATDRIDLYLLHWPGAHPLEETYAALGRLVEQGKILHYGVSNFDEGDLEASASTPGGDAVVANQVLYNLTRRGIEFDVLPRCRASNMLVLAYSPLEQGRLAGNAALDGVARRHGVTGWQVALAWTLREPGVMPVVKATRPEHVRDNAAATRLRLDARDMAQLDLAFPPSSRRRPLETL